MGLSVLRRLAARAPVPVFIVCGAGGRPAAGSLRLLADLDVVDSPRRAAVLLVVGQVPAALIESVQRVHDQVARPRVAVWWPTGAGGADLAGVLPGLVVAEPGDTHGLRRLFRELLVGGRPSTPASLPDVEPSPWRGVGPYGQGGTGMTGGVPYGRPMPGWADDRDGLKLDQLAFRIGPFFPPLPSGLVLDLRVQGDVLQHAEVGPNPFLREPGGPTAGWPGAGPFAGSHIRPVQIADLEVARGRHHLAWSASMLRLLGLPALGERVLRLAVELIPASGPTVQRLVRDVCTRRSVRGALAGVGPLGPVSKDAPGPVGRAAGSGADARIGDAAYEDLGFEPVAGAGDDAWGRFVQRLGEAAQAVTLAARAGERLRGPGAPLEGLRGPMIVGSPNPSAALLATVPALLDGLEWGDAMAAVVSLDVDMEEAAWTEVLEPSP